MNVKTFDVSAVPSAAPPPQTDLSQTGNVGESFQGTLDSKIQNNQQPKNKVEEVKKESTSTETKTETNNTTKETQTEKKETTSESNQQVAASVVAMIMFQTQLQEASKKKQGTSTTQKTATEATGKMAGLNLQNATKEAAVMQQTTTVESSKNKEDKTVADSKTKQAVANTSNASNTDASKEQAALKTAKDSNVLDGKENAIEITENNKEVVVSAKEGLVVDAKGQVTPFSEVITTVQNKSTQSSSVMTQVDQTIKDMMSEGQKTIRLQVSPENLGKVDIKLISGADGMQVILTAEKPGTGKLLESNLSQLQQSLMEAGVTIGHMSVSQQNAGNQQGWNESQQNNSSSTYKTPLVSAGDNTASTYVRTRSSMSALELQA